jgi:DNA (cytosine-5)-methyltransferase 1
MKPTFISLFSGIGGFDLGLERAGWECVAQAEIDPFCNKVLAKHWPGVKRYGDVRDVGMGCGPVGSREGDDLLDERGVPSFNRRTRHVDLICGGFPCQDLSVAGKRAGLSGERSGLWFEFHRVLSELRPTFCLIENVPGLLSSDQGRDFGIVLAGLGELWPAVGWAVLDSQHFGVPQRRRRVFIVGGPTRESVQQILSLCEGGDWHPQKGRETGEDVAATIRGRSSGAGVNEPGRGGEDDSNLVVANTLPGHHPRHDLDNDTYLPTIVGTLSDGAHNGGGLNGQDAYSGRIIAIQDARGVRNKAQNGIGITENADAMYTLDGTSQHAFQSGAAVRRLTPTECERLQGFPDGWTQLDEKTPDGPRYKALGNAVSVPPIEYLGLRLLSCLQGEI